MRIRKRLEKEVDKGIDVLFDECIKSEDVSERIKEGAKILRAGKLETGILKAKNICKMCVIGGV